MAQVKIDQSNLIITCPSCRSWLNRVAKPVKGNSTPSIIYDCGNRSCPKFGVKMELTTVDVVATEIAG